MTDATSSTSSTSATTSATSSIIKTLGSGSGLDTASIVSQLVQAQFAQKNASLQAQADSLTAQISGVAKLKSGITAFNSALSSLVKGGTLSTQPTSSFASVAGVSAISGKSVAGLAVQLTVNHLATAQAATTNTPVDPAAAFRTGTLSVTIGGTSTPITIGSGDATLTGIAAKINAAKLGLTASVIADGNGARLTIKGQTGAANAFTISAADDDPNADGMGLAQLAVGNGATGTSIGTSAADAELVIDGATYHRATNTISDLVPNVTLSLAGTGTTLLGTTPPTAAISQAVSDFVASYNEVQATIATETDPKTGELRSDGAARLLKSSLAHITTVSLAANGDSAPSTLADLGVATNRDGTLTVNTAKLATMLAKFPAAAEAMFADGSGAVNGGLSAALNAVATQATDPLYGFDADTLRLQTQQGKVTDAQTKASTDASTLSDQMTQQFSSMDSKVAAYKSTQSFLTAQIAAWNKTNN